ncbi:hypothetical protein [Amycolatopsis sp. NPDC051372]|uniref:hypothetical protein n=1 Tax=Amycolatopsis sp. NPDC051372 TaxID=3155669 RepID=UPI00341B9C17
MSAIVEGLRFRWVSRPGGGYVRGGRDGTGLISHLIQEPMMPVPALTAEQRESALEKANLLRQQRAVLLAAVKDGVVTLPGVLERPVSAQRLMDEVGISAGRLPD